MENKKLKLAKKAYALHDKVLAMYKFYIEEPRDKTYTLLDVLDIVADFAQKYVEVSDLIQQVFVEEIYDRTGKRPPDFPA